MPMGAAALAACASVPDGAAPSTLDALNGDYRVSAFRGAPAPASAADSDGRVQFQDGWLIARVGCNEVEGKMMLDAQGRLRPHPATNQGSLGMTMMGCRDTSDPTRPSAAERRDEALLDLLSEPVAVFRGDDGRVALVRGRYRLDLRPVRSP